MNKNNPTIGENVCIGSNLSFGRNIIIEDDVFIGDNVYIDHNTVIRSKTTIGDNSYVGANCIIGESLLRSPSTTAIERDGLSIGKEALIRSGSIIYDGSTIGDSFQTGHQVTIREKTRIGNHVSVGTLSDIQGNCSIGNYVRIHSNVHIGQLTVIDDYVWVYPYVVFTNDPTPPSEFFAGVYVHSFAIIATGAVIMPGLDIAEDSLVAAGAIVTRDVKQYEVVGGNPAKKISDVRNIRNHTTEEEVYPWRYHFERNMPWEGKGYEKWFGSEHDSGGVT